MNHAILLPLKIDLDKASHYNPLGLRHSWKGPWEVIKTDAWLYGQTVAHFVLGPMSESDARATIAELGTRLAP